MTAIAAPPDLKHYRAATTLTMQVEGIALPYDEIDSYGTTFARGCLARTARERVPAGKVRHFLDHGDVPVTGMYDTHLHIGTVREVWDEQLPDGRWVAKFRADIFDTAPGREAHEYLKAVAATGSETGVSIGMMEMPKTTRTTINGKVCDRIDEVALREISITSVPSVPGARVTSVRADVSQPVDQVTTPNYFALLDGIVAHLGPEAVRAHLRPILSDAPVENSDADAGAPRDSDSLGSAAGDSLDVSRNGTEPSAPNASVEERLAFVRANLHRLY